MATDKAKRALFKGRAAAEVVIRPPWSHDEHEFIERCTRCGKCGEACPTNIIVKGSGGFPQIDFAAGSGECELCQQCVEVCADNALELANPVWHWQLQLNEQACLAHQGVACRSCGEYCPTQAIRFKPQVGGQFVPQLDLAICNGCGACINPCPTKALIAKQVS